MSRMQMETTEQQIDRPWRIVSVTEDEAGRFVWLVVPGEAGFGTVERRAVTVGELTSFGLEIRSGLEDGDAVVTAGVSQLADGLLVKLLPAWNES